MKTKSDVRHLPIDLRQTHLVVLTPFHNGGVDLAFHNSMLETMRRFARIGIRLSTCHVSGSSHIAKAREELVWKAYREAPDFSHLLFIDSDMGWSSENILRLLASGHDICAVAGVTKSVPPLLAMKFYDGKQEFHAQTGFLKVLAVGAAFMLIKRCAIEQLVQRYPELKCGSADDRRYYALFLDMIADKQRLSEDLSFCRRWTDIGGEIWIDPYAKLIHAGRYEYTGNCEIAFNATEPASEAAE